MLAASCAASDVRILRLAGPNPTAGAPPESCRPALTGEGGPVAWQVLLVHNRASLAEVSRVAADNRFPLCVVDTVKARDVELGVSFTPVAGKIDRAAGLIFRVRDPNNYYVVRANALEDNVVLYKTVEGVRSALDIIGRKGGYGVSISVPANEWLSFRVEFKGSRFRVLYNGQQLFEVEDSTFPDAGKVGLWTKADSVTLFDQVTYGVAK